MARGVSTFTDDQSEYLQFLVNKDIRHNRYPNYQLILKRFKARFKSMQDITVDVIRKHARSRFLLKEKYCMKAQKTIQELRDRLKATVSTQQEQFCQTNQCEEQQVAARQQIAMLSEQYENAIVLLESAEEKIHHYQKICDDKQLVAEKMEALFLKAKQDKVKLLGEMDQSAIIISNMANENQYLKDKIDSLYDRMAEISRSSKSNSWEICYYNEVNKVDSLERKIYDLESQNIKLRNQMQSVEKELKKISIFTSRQGK